MRISDWSSEVCSSDLHGLRRFLRRSADRGRQEIRGLLGSCPSAVVRRFRRTARGSFAMTRAQLEDLIARANSGGYRINNLFQYQTGQWQANLRRDVGRVACFSYAKGDTPAEALAGAIRNAGIEERSEEHTSELQSLMRISYAV